MQMPVERLFQIIGEKEVELSMLRSALADKDKELAELRKKPPKGQPKADPDGAE